ncbi:RabGAP/TBC protein [Thecamonas trahens ATCC 50062]|uniref:RabGAP/TBC protein n=1 Tax=Thecamonas trahens ATCC 50062 TaxID=461836 RepID=A0A0L0DMM6_THETB|nr:RabGAP/TBC protein [Thecamonas trahens ATCC 50062]KNC52648.1 RabGAP/TBC protein [Thecamonas trahens ATCC 50062]|eukprot:XP_013755199.1 RabGAP/TBC protein [Thecamonas trahens ATCC 50062]
MYSTGTKADAKAGAKAVGSSTGVKVEAFGLDAGAAADGAGETKKRRKKGRKGKRKLPPCPGGSSGLVAEPVSLLDAAEAVDDHPLSLAAGSKFKAAHENSAMSTEILKDIARTCPELAFFQAHEPVNHYAALHAILLVYARLNPGIGYVQGMNELVALLYYVCFHEQPNQPRLVESDTFFCFMALMGEIRDNFCQSLDSTDSGVVSHCHALHAALAAADPILSQHLDDMGLNPQFYAFRWLTLLLSQEFDFPDVLRLWDSLFADPLRFEFMEHFASAMVLALRPILLEPATDFAFALQMLQNYPRDVPFAHVFALAVQLRDGMYEPPAPSSPRGNTSLLAAAADAAASASPALAAFFTRARDRISSAVASAIPERDQ